MCGRIRTEFMWEFIVVDLSSWLHQASTLIQIYFYGHMIMFSPGALVPYAIWAYCFDVEMMSFLSLAHEITKSLFPSTPTPVSHRSSCVPALNREDRTISSSENKCLLMWHAKCCGIKKSKQLPKPPLSPPPTHTHKNVTVETCSFKHMWWKVNTNIH